jgi:hypothetical protein
VQPLPKSTRHRDVPDGPADPAVECLVGSEGEQAIVAVFQVRDGCGHLGVSRIDRAGTDHVQNVTCRAAVHVKWPVDRLKSVESMICKVAWL